MSAINERLRARSSMDGWVEKNGSFSIGISSPVIGKLQRKTYLRAQVERDGSVTTIKGDVPNGASPRGRILVFAALALVAGVLIATGSMLLGIIILPFAAVLYIPMKGDYENSDILLHEVQRLLKAKSTPPKPAKSPARPTAPKSAVPRS